MAHNLIYHSDVKKVDLPKIDTKNKSKIKKAIEERLVNHPEVFGKPLQRTLKGYWKLRVGDYRVVYKYFENDIIILTKKLDQELKIVESGRNYEL
jgi:mRNA interferase RelE/StbE